VEGNLEDYSRIDHGYESLKREKVSILIVDDDDLTLRTISIFLKKMHYDVETCKNGTEAINAIKKNFYNIVLLDLKLPDIDGLEVLKKLKDMNPSISVIMMTGYGTIETAVRSMQYGAEDYLLKPFKKLNELDIVIQRVLRYKILEDENRILREQVELQYDVTNIIGKSKNMIELFKLVKKVAPLDCTVLIEGESGTGKELIARAIHQNSPRATRRFVAINCAAIPVNLLESELFGYEKGAYTGALERKKGYFEVADGGTLLLDEISEMPLELQAKLLRILQDKTFQRVGSTDDIIVDVRIIASTNKNLEDEVTQGRFRKDLYYRINVIKITVPPLRERKDDIPLLVQYFLEKHSKKIGKRIHCVSDEAMNYLIKYNWDGNVRELENVIERAVVLAESEIITVNELPDFLSVDLMKNNSDIFTKSYYEARQEFDLKYFMHLLKRTKGNISEVSRLAQIPRQNVYEKIKKLKIDVSSFR